MPELFRLNNNIRTSGIFRRADPVKIQFLYTLEDPDKRVLIYIPAINWNRSDGFMAGLVLNNGTLIPKPINYVAFPFYTFRNPGVVGYGKISFNIAPYDNLIRMATFFLEGEQFGAIGNQDFKKAKIGLDFHFRSAKMINPVNQKVFGYYIGASDLLQIENLIPAKMNSFLQFGYQLEKNGMVNPFNVSVSFESGKSFQKTSLEFNYRYSYIGKNSGLDMRLFAGAMLKDNNADPFFALSPSGRSGREQYLYDGTYPDLFGEFPKTFFSRQMTLSEGGLVTPVSDSLGYSKWICSLSFAAGLPGKASWIPVKGFVNFLLNDHGSMSVNKPQLFFEAGLKAGLWNFFEIYFPLVVSDNINPMAGSIKERFRFVFNLDMLGTIRLKSSF
jgi:hypothetical protein